MQLVAIYKKWLTMTPAGSRSLQTTQLSKWLTIAGCYTTLNHFVRSAYSKRLVHPITYGSVTLVPIIPLRLAMALPVPAPCCASFGSARSSL